MVIFYIAKKILTIIFYSVEDIIGKKMLTDEFISIYALLFDRAIFGNVLLVLFSIPFIFIKVTDKSGPNPERSIIFSRILNLFGQSNFLKIILFIIRSSE